MITNTSPRTFHDGRAWPRMNPGQEYVLSGPGHIIRMAGDGLMEIAVDSIVHDGNTILYLGALGMTDCGGKSRPDLIFLGKSLWAFPGQGAEARLAVYDPAGRLVAVLKDGRWDGPVDFETGFLRPGAYIALLESNNLRFSVTFVR